VTRDERLLVLAAELRAAAPASLRARALAERLAVSERTVQRDIAVLARSGLPVRRDESGGYTVQAVRPKGRAGPVAVSAGGVLDTLTEAVRERRIVRIAYVDQAGDQTRRDVEAHGLVLAPYGDYLVGWCRLRDAARQFRVDRVAAAYLTDEAAGAHDLDDLIAALRVPTPRAPADRSAGTPSRARAWTLDRIRHVRRRLTETATHAEAEPEPEPEIEPEIATRIGAARLARPRAVIGHLAEWSRWQVAAVRAVATGRDMTFDGRRPDFPGRFDDALGYPTRERMIQEAMAARSFGELVSDLDDVLCGAARWAADCPAALWSEPVPEPGLPGRSRPLADLLAGWWSPLSHVEWHLDRPAGDRVAEPDERLVTQCPLRT
jgi:predicted DNA-binding transcriptional regulator YafY